ncbi:PIG-L family deacetylase (plasmid) [Deinococcus metallilatus]|uniref:LmbE family N-acetylglucosaminyl deacetylase n=1 Tax=Deinococcus metallilatus TaxID=1211322 RepID=A0ABR6MYI1_9DEIO|nr:PIG-L deacetylase family protein [Deinococcus metallilatus]MBB5296978.1 LmbE family N-acetylglucosaminyl deacetylase [Deinococcus metallilatus]QBY06656.1 PIG-L family deacetylase [Deinococcus metallilatus]GMA15123.1 PIG-L domain-containing protein [Deinococcus metallilatus]
MPRLRRPPARPVLLGTLLLTLLALAAWINLPLVGRVFDRSADRVAALPAVSPFRPGQRVLVLSPHPDDETLCCAGMIQQAESAGAQVFIAWATAGDGFEFDAVLTQKTLRPGPQQMRRLGDLRVEEAQRAAAVLGVPPTRTFMLGYPDGGLFRLFTTNYAEPYTSPRTRASAVYVRGALTPGAPYTGRALETDLLRVLDRVRPDVVLAPAPQDFHPDHHTLSFIALRLMSARQQEDRLRFWVVHGGLEWPLPKGLHTNLPLTLPPLAARLPWERVDLTAAQEQRKLEAVGTYRTQTRVLGRFMHAFVRQNELLSPEPLPEQGQAPQRSRAGP